MNLYLWHPFVVQIDVYVISMYNLFAPADERVIWFCSDLYETLAAGQLNIYMKVTANPSDISQESQGGDYVRGNNWHTYQRKDVCLY